MSTRWNPAYDLPNGFPQGSYHITYTFREVEEVKEGWKRKGREK